VRIWLDSKFWIQSQFFELTEGILLSPQEPRNSLFVVIGQEGDHVDIDPGCNRFAEGQSVDLTEFCPPAGTVMVNLRFPSSTCQRLPGRGDLRRKSLA
jgi:hypothetical protein